MRQNWEADEVPEYYNFGTAIHAGREAWYDPTGWHEPLKLERAQAAFVESWLTFVDYYERTGIMDSWTTQKVLGIEMLKEFAKWSEINDAHLTPVACEMEFNIPIVINTDWFGRNYLLPHMFKVKLSEDKVYDHVTYLKGSLQTSGSGILHYRMPGLYTDYEPVMFGGRIDNVFKDAQGNFYIDDGKTAATFKDDLGFLDFDEQLSSYAWALNQLGYPVKGIYYTEMHKSFPQPPQELHRELKNGTVKIGLSKNKSQNTSKELYLKALEERNLNPADYEEFLQWLSLNPGTFIRRTNVPRSQRQLDLLTKQIAMEAIDMLNNPSIYINPGYKATNCYSCEFRPACLNKLNGEDSNFYLEGYFHKRD
jgi:hypothetical protein